MAQAGYQQISPHSTTAFLLTYFSLALYVLHLLPIIEGFDFRGLTAYSLPLLCHIKGTPLSLQHFILVLSEL